MGRNGEDKEGGVVEHTITGDDFYEKPVFKHIVHCSCGASWTFGKEATIEHQESIFESHKKYFNNKTLVL